MRQTKNLSRRPCSRAWLALIALFALCATAVSGYHSDAFASGAGKPGHDHRPAGASPTISNDTFWKDTDGKPIFSQGGGIFDFTDPVTGAVTHYWYGVRYSGAATYFNNPTKAVVTGGESGGDTFVSVVAYSSSDLVNWKFEGDVLNRQEVESFTDVGTGKATWVGRTGVAYVKELRSYALFIQHGIKIAGQTRSDGKQLVAVSDSPTGPFRADRRLDMTTYHPDMTTPSTGDQTIFTDDVGDSYLVYSKSDGRNRIFVSKIEARNGKVDLGRTEKIYDGFGREGNCMFEYNGKFYMSASDLFGWNASRAYYLVADNVFGPYTPTNDMPQIPGAGHDFAHTTQTGFYYTVKGTRRDTVIYAGDRWADFAGNGLGYNQWTPLSFGRNGTPHFNSVSQWKLNAVTGDWAVANGNNYVLNGAFEADRVKAPYTDKDGRPVPDIAGWVRTNPAAVWNDTDSSGRVGNFNLTFTATTAYAADIKQKINPANFSMSNGRYTLSAQIQKPGDVSKAKLYASSGGRVYKKDLADLPATGTDWITVSLPVTVTGGKATVGLSVHGNAGQILRADDITLTRGR